MERPVAGGHRNAGRRAGAHGHAGAHAGAHGHAGAHAGAHAATATPEPTATPTPEPVADGAIRGFSLVSDAEGELTVSWDTADPAPSDYRVSWGPADQEYLGWQAENETQRGNAYPGGGETSLTLTGLPSGAEYQVRMRARYFNDGDTSPQWSGSWQEATVTLAGAPEESRVLLWSHTMTVEELNSGWPITHKGFSGRSPWNPWRVALPDGSTMSVLVVASRDAGTPFYWSVLSGVTTDYDHALLVVVGEAEFAFADAMIVEGSPVGHPYVWPEGGPDWAVGETVELKLYHLPGAPAATLPRVELPGRSTGVTLVPTETGELTVTWEAPANAETAHVLDYLVYLKREAGEWSAAERRVFTPTGAQGERRSVGYSGLEGGIEYRALVYARNVVALGAFGYSEPVPAPERTPATLSSVSLTGISELDFVPHQARYLVQVEPGITEITVSHETTEVGATSEVTVVRVGGKLEADEADGDPDTAGHQARLSSNGDTLVLVKVTSADEMRQDIYGVILDQQVGNQGNRAGNSSGRSLDESRGRPKSSSPWPRLGSLTLSYGEQTVATSYSNRARRANVPYEVSQITVAATEAHGGEAWVIPSDADPDLPGHQVKLRAGHPGGQPAQTAFAVVVAREFSQSGDPCVNCYTCGSIYRVVVTRGAPTETDATLKSLEVSGAELSRSFLYDFVDYTASASHDTATATIKALPNQAGATVSYDPMDADDSADGYQRTLTAGDNPVTITVRAPDGTTTQDYTVTINLASPAFTDATLESLAIGGATVSPSFESSVKAYAATVASRISLITLDLETGDDGATIGVNPPDANPDVDGWQIPVGIGANTVTITVTAEDGSTTGIYTLTVNRNSLETEAAPLGSLAVAGATLLPAFGSDVLSYTALVGNDTAQVTVTATGENEGSRVAVDQMDQDDMTNGYQVNLEEGRNTIIITVTGTDGMATREYALTVFRTPAAADTTGFLQVDAGWSNSCGLRVDHTLACTFKWREAEMRNYIPEGIFERVSVKKYVACALAANGSQLCWDNDGARPVRTGVKVGDYSAAAEYGADICNLGEDGNIRCQDSRRRDYWAVESAHTVEGPFKAIGQTRRGVCAIRSDDLVRCWGYILVIDWDIYFGPIELPNAYLDTEFKFIAGGRSHACGIRKSDNALLCWRWDDNAHDINLTSGIAELPAPAGEFTFVDAGAWRSSCGVRIDGTAECWRVNWAGQFIYSEFGDAPGGADIGYHTVSVDQWAFACGLRKDNQIKCWGIDERHQGEEVNTKVSNDSPWRNNAQLLGMDLGGVDLSTAFDREVYDYAASVTNDVESVTVQPVLTNSLSFYAIYSETGGAAGDDGVVTLAEGANVIHVHVISADRTVSNTYTVTVTRAAD